MNIFCINDIISVTKEDYKEYIEEFMRLRIRANMWEQKSQNSVKICAGINLSIWEILELSHIVWTINQANSGPKKPPHLENTTMTLFLINQNIFLHLAPRNFQMKIISQPYPCLLKQHYVKNKSLSQESTHQVF